MATEWGGLREKSRVLSKILSLFIRSLTRLFDALVLGRRSFGDANQVHCARGLRHAGLGRGRLCRRKQPATISVNADNLCCRFGSMRLMVMRRMTSVIIKFHRFLKLKTLLLLLRSRQSAANLGTLPDDF
jgi:hypothetical protein